MCLSRPLKRPEKHIEKKPVQQTSCLQLESRLLCTAKGVSKMWVGAGWRVCKLEHSGFNMSIFTLNLVKNMETL